MKNNIEYYLNELLKEDVSIEEYADDAFTYRLFFKMFQKVPYVMYFFDKITDEDLEDEEEPEEYGGEFDYRATCKNIKKNVKCDIYTWKGNDMFIGENWIVFKGTIFCSAPKIPDCLSECIVVNKKDTANLIFVSVNSKGNFVKKLLPVKDVDIDYDLNYNEDFPHEKIEEIITADESGLILNFGIPGTGNVVFIDYIY